MKLKVTDWKHAWFESHISERFFQEMGKLERGAVQGLESTAQWTEQIMIEVGLLAQAMIRLEQDGAPEPQIRQACDRAMRLSALALHLITALDGADREQLRSSAIVRGDSRDWKGRPVAPAAGPGQANATQPAAPAKPQSGPSGSTRPPVYAPTVPRPPGSRRPGAQAQDSVPEPMEMPDAPMISSLLHVAGREVPRSESQLRQIIVSLSQQGLSRAEIEMVTGEPRHVIEAVLNHARSQQIAGAQPG